MTSTRRIAKTREQRLAAPRRVSTPQDGFIGTIRLMDSGFWEYVRKNGSAGMAHTAREAVEKLGPAH